jgi:cytoskeletal protein RodZ
MMAQMKNTKQPSDPCDGEPAHERVLEQFRKLTCDDGLLVQTVKHVKESNALTKTNAVHLRVLSYILAVCVAVLIGVVSVLWLLLHDTKAHLTSTLDRIDQLSRSVQVNTDKVDAVKVSTDEIKQTQDNQPTVELVPEPDPVKAKDAPIKVRITPPKDDKSSAPPAPTVEVPIPVKDAKMEDPKK